MADDVQAVEQSNIEQGETSEASTQPAVEATQAETLSEEQAPVSDETKQDGLLSRVEDNGETKQEVPEEYEAFEGEYLNEQAASEIVNLAKEKQLTQDQANVLAQGYDLAVKSLMEENKQAMAENVKAFEADPQGKENALLAVKALDHLGVKDYFVQRGYDSDYTLIQRILAPLGQMLSEDKVVTGSTSGPVGTQSPYGEEWK